jgi:hypothetical protein
MMRTADVLGSLCPFAIYGSCDFVGLFSLIHVQDTTTKNHKPKTNPNEGAQVG